MSCVMCGNKKIKRKHFKSDDSWNEYLDSGICEKCQDEAFSYPQSQEEHKLTRDLFFEKFYPGE